jgi:hypothetical protein
LGKEKPNSGKERPLLKRLGNSGRKLIAGTALGLGLAGPAGAGVATGLATMTAPRKAKADPVTIRGITAEEVQLDVRLNILDRATDVFRGIDASFEVYNDETGRYGNSLVVPGVVTFLVTLEPGQKSLDLAFTGESGDTSYINVDLTEFANDVRRLTGRELDGQDLGVRMVIHRSTTQYEGEEIPLTTLILIPVDAQSNQYVSIDDNDPCLAHMEFFFANSSQGGTAWVENPPASPSFDQ